MSEGVRDLLVRGVAAAKAKEIAEARFYLEMVVRRSDASRDQICQAWLWLSQLSDDLAEKRECMENILVLNPAHPAARRGLAILDGRLKPEDVVDHRQPVQPVRPSSTPESSDVRRYVCPRCGGKMTFDARRRALTCSYCGARMSEYQAIMDGALVQERDFFATLPTAEAHRWELPTERVLTCEGCGATFTLPPSSATGECPFCESAYLVETAESRELIRPEGVLPFRFDADAAVQCVRQWLIERDFRPDDLDSRAAIARPRGVYVPFWSFDVGGEVKWNAFVREGDPLLRFGRDDGVSSRNDVYFASHDDLLIPASHSLPVDLLSELADFDTKDVAPYSADLLAGWLTELYQVSMADASLVARQRVFDAAKAHAHDYILGDKEVLELTCSSLGLAIDTYKLVLLPVWMTGYRYEGKYYPLGINGQTGKVVGEVPRSGLQEALARVFGDASGVAQAESAPGPGLGQPETAEERAATEFVVSALAKNRNRNDVIMELCERTGRSWDEAERFVRQVQSRNRQKIAARQSPLLLFIGAITLIGGLSLAAYVVIATLSGRVYYLPYVPIPYLGNLSYFSAGLAMTSGGTVGILRAGRTLLKGA